MQNSTLKTKLQNLISSEQFCGLCFEYSEENSTDIELEEASDDWSHRIKLGDIYSSVFRESTEDLASRTICSKCTEHLIQSYTFIQNTKFTSGLLSRCLNDLQTELLQLKGFTNIELDSDNVCVILAGAENNDKRNSEGKELHCTLCQQKFGALQDFLNHYKQHSRMKHVNYFNAKSLKDIKTTENIRINHTEIRRPNLKPNKSKISLNTQDPKNKILDKKEMTCRFEMEVHKKSNGIETQKSQTEKSIMARNILHEKMQCIMCKDIAGQNHKCQYKCSTCNEDSCIHFAHLIHFRDQILTKSIAKCLSCDFLCKDKEVLIDHVNKYHLDFICDLCGQNFCTKFDIQTHLTSKHFDCIVLNVKNYKDKLKLKYEKGAMKMNSLKDEKREISCDICQRSFENITLMKQHQKSHTKHVESNLRELSKSPIQRTRNTESILISKKVKPKITCELCGYITWNSILLDCHMNRYHLKIKPYVCHICSKNFIGKHLLKKHILTHTVDQSIICNFCGKKLANLPCLKNHLKLHTGEKNYECQVCGEKFRSASIRSVHRVKKHSVKEAACPLCLSKFYTLVELRKHIIKMHWKKKTKFDPRELEGMENHYHLFHDGRRIRMGDEDVDFYMPC